MGRDISRWEEDFNPVQLLGVGDKRWKGGGGRGIRRWEEDLNAVQLLGGGEML